MELRQKANKWSRKSIVCVSAVRTRCVQCALLMYNNNNNNNNQVINNSSVVTLSFKFSYCLSLRRFTHLYIPTADIWCIATIGIFWERKGKNSSRIDSMHKYGVVTSVNIVLFIIISCQIDLNADRVSGTEKNTQKYAKIKGEKKDCCLTKICMQNCTSLS